MLTVHSLLDELGLELAAGEPGRGEPGSLGPHLRARGPDSLALGRRADADHRDPARQRRRAARLRRSCWSATTWRASASAPASATRKLPKALVDEAAQAGVPPLRGPLLDAVHRDHREGLLAPRQRAVRGAAARDRRAAPARAAGAGGARSGGDRRDDLLGGRRHGQHPRRPRRAARRPRLSPRALRGGRGGDPRRGPRPPQRRAPLHPLAPVGRRAGARAPGHLARRRHRRRPGWRSSATPAGSATSSR